MEQNRLGCLQDVADFLRIEPDTARRWASSGYLPCITIGRNEGTTCSCFHLTLGVVFADTKSTRRGSTVADLRHGHA